jgi:SAM-dependent methyltransferase
VKSAWGRQSAPDRADLARYYDLDLLSDPGDLAFYLDLAASSDGRILELAAGSGRVAVPLAAAGHDVTGADSDAAMLQRASAAWARVDARDPGGSLTLVDHDLTTLSLPTRFGLIILALNSILLLESRAAQARALKVMRAHLAPGGHAVIDVWTPSPDDLELYDGRQVLDWIRTDPQTSERVAKTTVAHYDQATNTAELTTTFHVQREDATTRSITRRDAITFITAAELLELARSVGLEPRQVLDDYAGTPWSEASERVVLVAGGG